MGLVNWIQKQFLGKDTIEVSAEDIQKYVDRERMNELCATEYYVMVITTMMANIFANCEFRTCMKGEEVKEDEYYLWNYEPNRNQNGADFKKQLISRMIEKNECLIVEAAGQLLIADSYTLVDGNVLMDKIFTDVSCGELTFNRAFQMSEVMFFKLNRESVKSLINSISEGYKQIAKEALEGYKKENGRKGTLKIDSLAQNKQYGERKFQDIYQELIETRFEKYFNAKNAVLPLFEGFTYTEEEKRGNKSTNKVSDYIKAVNEIAYKVAMAFGFPPKILTGEVAGLGDTIRMLLSVAVDPLAKTISTEANRKRYGKKVLENSYMWIDTSTILHIDLFAVAEQVDKLIASGLCSIDELRRKAALLELNTEESQKHWITKNYQEVKNAVEKGGNEDGSTNS